MSIEVKGQLAKLLATEDLLIEHRKVSTASFDVKNRVLTLPIWKDLTNDVYDLLVGHEVAHALYTPVEWNIYEIPQSYLNIVEDARIERLIKKTYPGLLRSFFNGYQELWKKDFFSVKGKNADKLPLIDRINLHFKIGDYLLIDFNDQESEFVQMVSETQTYADVIEVARLIYKYVGDQEQQDQQQTVSQGQDGQAGDSVESDSNPSEASGDSSEEVEQQSSTPGEDDSSKADSQTPEGGVEAGQTDSALQENMMELNDTNSKDCTYCTLPDYNLDNIIIDYTEVNKDLEQIWNREGEYYDIHRQYVTNSLKKFRDSCIKTVNYLVKEFESKKAAEGYARRAVSRTGVLDMSKLHTYKWNEDVFKKITTIPDSKNHGMIFFLDWSGSMCNVLKDTAKQLLNLVWFCRKVGIAFEVYSFTEGMDYHEEVARHAINNIKQGDIFVSDSLRLTNWLSSRSSKADFEKSVKYFWGQVTTDCLSHYKYSLGGTPLADTILMTPQIVKRFKKISQVQKMSCIYLSDGESCMLRTAIVREREEYNHETSRYETTEKAYGRQVRHWDRLILRSKNYTAEVNTDGCSVTRGCLDYVKKLIPDVNLLGVRLIERRAIRWYMECLDANYNPIDVEQQWKNDRSVSLKNVGYDQVYLLPFDKSLGEDAEEISVNEGASKAQLTKAFKKHMGSKMTNKKILTNFITQIA
jgi:hypothetical protein